MVVRSSLIILSLSLVTTGCTAKKSQRNQHSGPRASFIDRDASSGQILNEVQEIYGKREDLSKKINTAKTAEELLKTALELEKSILNNRTLTDANLSGRSEFRLSLSLLNRAISRAYDLDKNLVLNNGILNRYRAFLFANCDSQYKSCSRLEQFRDSLTSRIFLLIAEQLEADMEKERSLRSQIAKQMTQSKGKDCRFQSLDCGQALKDSESRLFQLTLRYYGKLKLAYEMANANGLPELDQKYIRYSRDYFDSLRNSTEGAQRTELLRRHRDTLTLALGHVRNQTSAGQTNQRYCQFLEELNPLDAEMFNNVDFDKRSQRNMLAEFIECTTQKEGRLDQIIRAFNQKQNARASERYQIDQQNQTGRFKVKDEGYAYALATLKDSPSLARNLNVDLNDRSDLAFFILDRVFYQQIDLNVAQSYWNRIDTKKFNDVEFLKFVRNYARAQAAYVTKVTLQNYGRILSEHFKAKGGLGSDFFHDVTVKINSDAQFDWDELTERLNYVKEFLIKTYDHRLSRSLPADQANLQQEYFRLKEELGTITSHVSLAVTTPMSLPLYYYMAKAQGTIKFHVPWFPSSNQWFDVQASEVLSKFFQEDKSRQMLFKFADLDQSLDSLQKLHSFDYALRIGIFDFVDFALLEEDKRSGLSGEALFFKQLFKDIPNIAERALRSKIQELEILERGQDFYEFMNACEDPIHFPRSLKLNEMSYSTLMTEGVREVPNRIYGVISTIHYWRYHRDVLSKLIGILDAHIASDPLQSANKQAIVGTVKNEMESFLQMERRLVRKMFELDRKVVSQQRNCLSRLVKTDFLRRREVMNANVEYFKDIHAAMSILQAIGSREIRNVDEVRQAVQTSYSQASDQDVLQRAHRILNLVSSTNLLSSMKLEDALNELFRIHNIDQAPYDGIGYLVTGIPTTSKQGPRVKSISGFSSSVYSQSQWDSMARVRRQMQIAQVQSKTVNDFLNTAYSGIIKLAPNLSVLFGSYDELLLNNIYTNNHTTVTNYSRNQDEFVQSAMYRFAGENNGIQYVNWYSPGGLNVSLLEVRENWLKQLESLGPIETTDQDAQSCPKDQWGRSIAVRDISQRPIPGAPQVQGCQSVRVGAQDVIDNFMDSANALRLTDNDRQLLELMNRRERLGSDIKKMFAYRDEPSTSKWTYFDQFYRTHYSTITVYDRSKGSWDNQVEDIRGRRDFTAFKDSFQKRIENAPALFPLRKAPTLVERNLIRSSVFDHLQATMEFEEIAMKIEDSRVDFQDYVIERTTTARADEPTVFNGWRVMQIQKRTQGPRAGTPIYLRENDSAKSWFASFVESFIIKETDCSILPEAGDPDFKTATSEDCRQRFNLWKAEQQKVRSELRHNIRQTSAGR